MPAGQVIAASLEFATNKLLSMDDTTQQAMSPLQNKRLKVTLRELPWPLVFHFTDQVHILAEQADHHLEADCSLSLSLSTLQTLQDSSRLTQLIQRNELTIDGDLQVAQAFSQLMTNLDIDWEEQLARYTGDVAAHSLFTAGGQLVANAKRHSQRLLSTLRDGALEEKELMAPPLLVTNFCDQVDQARSHLNRLEARLALLENSQTEQNQTDQDG